MKEPTFGDLRRLADWLAAPSLASPLWLDRLLARLGRTAVPVLGRALRGGDAPVREAARRALATLSTGAGARARVRVRVIDELRAIADDARTCDEAKVCAVGLLGELGERGDARFADPAAIRQRSASALAAQLDTPAEIAAAVDLMLRSLGDDEILDMIDALVESAAPAAARIAAEIACRLDASAELRARAADACDGAVAPTSARRDRPTRASVLVDAAARLVIVAARKVPGERRWRRWAVLIGASGRIDDCMHADAVGDGGEAQPLIDGLVAEGYRVASTDVDHARAIVSAAARLTASERPTALCSSYYLGRDLLELGDDHLDGRARVAVVATTLGRAVDLIATGEHARARALLARCDASKPEVASALAACLVADGNHADAIAHLARACEADREWPLHHWNLAASLHVLGDVEGCCLALRNFLAASDAPTGLDADADQAARVALARRWVADHERATRLLDKPPRRRSRSRRVKSP